VIESPPGNEYLTMTTDEQLRAGGEVLATASDNEHRPAPTSRRPPAGTGTGAVLGVVTGAVAIGVGHLVAGIVDPQASPLIVVGQAAIDATPEWLKSWAIRTFGSSDKTVLLWSMGVVLALISVALGIASVRRLRVGIVGLVGFGALGVIAAITRPAARPVDALPPVVGALVAAGVLVLIRRPLDAAPAARREGRRSNRRTEPGGFDRRRFLLTAVAGTAAAAAAGGIGDFLARRFRADESRAAVGVPSPESPAAPVEGTDLAVAGVGPFFTPNDTFYRVDTALLVPAVVAEEWKLVIHGMVDREITLDYEQLRSRPLIERDITLTCVSNPVGGSYIGNARWIGTPLKDLLEEAGVQPGADQIVTRSVDGFTIGTPTAVAMDGRDAMLAIAMNGQPLPLVHGFPVRMIVPGLYGYVSAMKWVVDMQLTTFDAFDPYWIERGWAERGPIKTMSRIDTPRSQDRLKAGEVPIAGIAWAQHTGIDRVDVQIDGGRWLPAELGTEDTIDTWRQWVHRWNAVPGDHQVRVRATDRSGFVQASARTEPFPDGAEGQHTIAVHVT
jgi:DMSO/TMAO reductase YedYZ molybdopterin-dependent catalytic subunit